jgi:hypothetical protein
MEYVNLGLPSGNLWATCNVGATTSEKSGNYYSYQESLEIQTEEKILPSKEDFQELLKYCTWKLNYKSYKITGPNGSSIYLPITGYYDKSLRGVGEYGCYWSSTVNKFDNRYAYYFHFDHNYRYVRNSACYFKHSIRLIKKKNMEKRKIEITINTAKEWYNSNNESLKAVALQAFSEQELKDFLPKTWEEYATSNKDKLLYYINGDSEFKIGGLLPNNHCKNSLNTKADAEAHLALMQLHVLRDAYRDYYQKGWKPDWNGVNEMKFCIYYHKDEMIITTECFSQAFLSFPTKELAEQFLENFKELIKKAKDLI